MTALVGILNKRAAVIAADSAVTITNGDNRTIINTAKKIFRLSNSNPVGVMIYNSAEFMGIPWDVLIKLYRHKNNSKSFDTLKEYVDDFINFLRHNKHCVDKESQENYLCVHAHRFFKKINDLYDCALKKASQNNPERLKEKKVLKICLDTAFDVLHDNYIDKGHGSEFDGYTQQQFHSYAQEALDKLEKLRKENKLPGSQSRWEKEFYDYIISNYFLSYTGLVFVGYGDDDIYPSLISVKLSGFVENKLRFYIGENALRVISNNHQSSVCTFAQNDVMLSLMKGMNPDMFDIVMEKYEEYIDSIKKQVIATMKECGIKDKQIEKISQMDLTPITDQFGNKINDSMYDHFSSNVVDAVDSFNIEDMVNMAESLISITNLQRHISSWEESVGGPVDVAVITKSEGFVWVNHKQWYQQEMNPQMLEKR